jgi:hypothetical protein
MHTLHTDIVEIQNHNFSEYTTTDSSGVFIVFWDVYDNIIAIKFGMHVIHRVGGMPSQLARHMHE